MDVRCGQTQDVGCCCACEGATVGAVAPACVLACSPCVSVVGMWPRHYVQQRSDARSTYVWPLGFVKRSFCFSSTFMEPQRHWPVMPSFTKSSVYLAGSPVRRLVSMMIFQAPQWRCSTISSSLLDAHSSQLLISGIPRNDLANHIIKKALNGAVEIAYRSALQLNPAISEVYFRSRCSHQSDEACELYMSLRSI